VSVPPAALDYTNLGYTSLRRAMLELARESLPEYTDLSENDLGVMLIELFAYASDVTLYYQTRIAENLFPETSDEPESLLQLLRLIGYELLPPAPARVDLRIGVDPTIAVPLTLPARTRFTATTPDAVPFETVETITVTPGQLGAPDPDTGLRYYFPIPVVQGATQNDQVAASDGSPNQLYPLPSKPAVSGSIEVVVNEPGGPTSWREVETLATSTPVDRDFTTEGAADGSTSLLFGDGLNGMIPPAGAVISATYLLGGTTAGNIAAGIEFTSAVPEIKEVKNPAAAAGGTDVESVDRARRLAPRLFRTQDRAVTTDDYRDLVSRVPGVGKVEAVAAGWNEIVLYVAPAGVVTEPSDLLKRDVLAYLEPRRMATTSLRVVGPQAADIYLRATVNAQPYYYAADVQRAVEAAVASYLGFDAVTFAQQIYLSKVYDLIQSLPQVASLNVTEFSRASDGTTAQDGVISLAPYELPRPGYRDNPDTPPFPSDPTLRPPIVTTIVGGAQEAR
jgi:baseplate J-like protein